MKYVSADSCLSIVLNCKGKFIGISSFAGAVRNVNIFRYTSKSVIAYSKLTSETLWKCWNMFKVNNKDTRTTPMASIYVFIWTYFTPCSSVSIFNFEQLNIGWETACMLNVLRHSVLLEAYSEFWHTSDLELVSAYEPGYYFKAYIPIKILPSRNFFKQRINVF